MQPAPYIVHEVGSHPADVVSVLVMRSDHIAMLSVPVAAKSNIFGLVGGGFLALRADQQAFGSCTITYSSIY